jgi:hypothetical protein
MTITKQLNDLLAQLDVSDLAEMPPMEFEFLARKLETWATLAYGGQKLLKAVAAQRELDGAERVRRQADWGTDLDPELMTHGTEAARP